MQIEFESSRLSAVQQAAASVVGSVTTAGVSSFISEVAKQIEHETSVKRRYLVLSVFRLVLYSCV